MKSPGAQARATEFARYTLASAVALAVDYGCYWLLATYGRLDLPQAAVAGYAAGLGVAYFLIAGRVFRHGWLRDRRLYESGLFMLSGGLGIALTYATVALFVYLVGERINQAKLAAVAISFIGVYLFRKAVVFRQEAGEP